MNQQHLQALHGLWRDNRYDSDTRHRMLTGDEEEALRSLLLQHGRIRPDAGSPNTGRASNFKDKPHQYLARKREEVLR